MSKRSDAKTQPGGVIALGRPSPKTLRQAFELSGKALDTPEARKRRERRDEATHALVRKFYHRIPQIRGVAVDPDGDPSVCEPTLLELWLLSRRILSDPLCNLQGEGLQDNAFALYHLAKYVVRLYPHPPYGGEKDAAVGEEVERWIRMGFTQSEARQWVAEHLVMSPAAVTRAHQRCRRTRKRDR